MSARRQNRTNTEAIREIEAGLKSLSKGLRRLAGGAASLAAANGKAAPRRRISAALRLQGRYMGLIRTLPGRKKARVMAIRASKGVEHAIRLARELRA
jgi:hypothetical protein